MAKRVGERIYSLNVTKLKNLSGLDEITFENNPLTGVFGPNCCGKSTILHALACCYQPPARSTNRNYKFNYFFTPNTDALWSGSEIKLTHKYRYQGNEFDRKQDVFKKRTSQWKPRYDKRPERHVSYIGVSSCVPMIEKEHANFKINYTTSADTSVTARQTIDALGKVFNRCYDGLNEHSSQRKTYKGLVVNGLKYSSLSMGAGEQRLLHILSEVFSCPRKGLILIDEIDLLMHGDALQRFLDVVNKRVTDMEIQIVFTSHRERLLEYEDIINVRHIYVDNVRTYVFNNSNQEALRRLTGRQQRPIEIFVEDDLATAIINKIAGSLGIKKLVETTRFGAAINAFTIAAAMALREESFENVLFVLDGDVYRTRDEKAERINAVLTGTSQKERQNRDIVLGAISQFELPEDSSPEKYIHKMLLEIDMQLLDSESMEIIQIIREVENPVNRHDYLLSPIEHLGYAKSEGFQKVVDIASESALWNIYTLPIANWLTAKRDSISLQSDRQGQ